MAKMIRLLSMNIPPFKLSKICLAASVLSWIGVVWRGDLMCASTATTLLVLAFLAFGLAAVVLFIMGIIQENRRTPENSN
jgi:hypothetical protein